MAEEQVYSVSGSTAVAARRVKLTELGLMERSHLQEWVIAHPQILGEEALIITFEFDRWFTSAGDPPRERLDVLALDRDGRLLVAELKRDRAPDSVVVQALNYAAMVSRFTVDLLVEAFLDRHPELDGPEAALAELQGWAPDLADETLSSPKVVLVAEEFGPVITNTMMFLIERGLEMRLIRIQLYELADRSLALTASQLLPVPASEDFMVRPRSGSQTQRATTSRRSSIPDRLVSSDIISEGEQLQIVVPAGVAENRDLIDKWLSDDPRRRLASWKKDARTPIVWTYDNGTWNLTTLIRSIIEQATSEPARTQVWGPNWFRNEDGVVLHKLAEMLPDTMVPAGRFDWTRLHSLLSLIPKARWTTYSDVAAVIGTAAQPVGSHIATCDVCPNVWRVLGIDGRPRRDDSIDSRTQIELLESEGVAFNSGFADPVLRLTSANLQALDSSVT